jgi:hypothetical protein
LWIVVKAQVANLRQEGMALDSNDSCYAVGKSLHSLDHNDCSNPMAEAMWQLKNRLSFTKFDNIEIIKQVFDFIFL